MGTEVAVGVAGIVGVGVSVTANTLSLLRGKNINNDTTKIGRIIFWNGFDRLRTIMSLLFAFYVVDNTPPHFILSIQTQVKLLHKECGQFRNKIFR